MGRFDEPSVVENLRSHPRQPRAYDSRYANRLAPRANGFL